MDKPQTQEKDIKTTSKPNSGSNRFGKRGSGSNFGNSNFKRRNSSGDVSNSRRDRRDRRGGQGGRFKKRDQRSKRSSRKTNQSNEVEFESKVIQVRRVTRVVKGGKRMRFSALVVVGDKKGKVGFAVRKGVDFQDSVAKATTKAKKSLIEVDLNEAKSLAFPSKTKFKSSQIYLKPANSGTGLIAGGFVRPVLELVGIENLYTKILRSRNKVAGTEAVIEALKKYQVKTNI